MQQFSKNLLPDDVAIHINMFSAFMKHGIVCYVDGRAIVTKQSNGFC